MTSAANKSKGDKKRKSHYLPHNRPVKKGSYGVTPGVEGFFITCDGGREGQAKREALNIFDRFYEELLQDKGLKSKTETTTNVHPSRPTRIVFKSDDEESSDDEDGDSNQNVKNESDVEKKNEGKAPEEETKESNKEEAVNEKQGNKEDCENELNGEVEPPAKKQHIETNDKDNAGKSSEEHGSIDKLIEAELEELGNKEKAKFLGLDSGCNGVVFIRMRRDSGCPGPIELVEYMMNKLSVTKKHVSRFILRVLPVESTSYSSPEEIEKAAKPLIDKHFPTTEGQTPIKFAVMFESRANTGIDRMTIINTVAKMVPQPHKVDLSHPDKSIIVQIVKTICMVGVVQKFKELSKYNIRELTGSQKP